MHNRLYFFRCIITLPRHVKLWITHGHIRCYAAPGECLQHIPYCSSTAHMIGRFCNDQVVALQACLKAITKVQISMSRINIYDIYADVCLPRHNEITQLASQLSTNGFNLSSTVAAVGTGGVCLTAPLEQGVHPGFTMPANYVVIASLPTNSL